MIELMIALAITSIVIVAATAVFLNLQQTSTEIDHRTNLSANARGAMFFIEDHIKLLGFNPAKDKSKSEIIRIAGGGELEFLQDNPVMGQPDVTIHIGLNPVGDPGATGVVSVGGATSLVINGGNVADDIVAIGFAYGFDDDENGDVDTDPATNQIIWAIDSNGDGTLDTSLDTNFDGVVDAADAPQAIPAVDISKIRAVKAWLLVRTKYPIRGATDNTTYYVGANAYTPNNNFGHMLHTTGTRCRNLF